MGRRRKNFYQEIRKDGNFAIDFDSDTEINECTSSSAQLGSKSLNHFLEQLYEKRGSMREAALFSIILSYTLRYQYQFSEKNFSALLYQCLKSFKRGSIKENCLAVEALGLLAITIGCGENSSELYKETAPVLSEALNTESQPQKLKLILDSLAIITFVGGNELEETERSMQSIWQFMHSRTDFKACYDQIRSSKCSNLLLVTPSEYNGKLDSQLQTLARGNSFFQESTSSRRRIHYQRILDTILELGCIEKFEGDTLAMEEMNLDTILDAHVPEISVKIGKQILRVNTLPQQIQLNFLKRLLGSSFVTHMRENELLHDVFKFKPEKRQLGRELYVAERDEVAINLFVPDVRREDSFQRIHKSQNSIFVKARTQIRNKHRDIKGEEQWCSGD